MFLLPAYNDFGDLQPFDPQLLPAVQVLWVLDALPLTLSPSIGLTHCGGNMFDFRHGGGGQSCCTECPQFTLLIIGAADGLHVSSLKSCCPVLLDSLPTIRVIIGSIRCGWVICPFFFSPLHEKLYYPNYLVICSQRPQTCSRALSNRTTNSLTCFWATQVLDRRA